MIGMPASPNAARSRYIVRTLISKYAAMSSARVTLRPCRYTTIAMRRSTRFIGPRITRPLPAGEKFPGAIG